MNATNIVSKAKVIPNLATMIHKRMVLGELEVQTKNRTNVPDAERANEKI